jgi:hypothetical protein
VKNNWTVIFLILLVAGGFYFLGRKSASNKTLVEINENSTFLKQIAELAALHAAGNVDIKVSNKDTDGGNWAKFKNYFTENTLQVAVPYSAKYGVDLANQKLKLSTKDSTVEIILPPASLLSLQLELDKMQTMSQTGLFTKASSEDLAEAQKLLYEKALAQLKQNQQNILLAQKQVEQIFVQYYKPLGYNAKVKFQFTEPKQTVERKP